MLPSLLTQISGSVFHAPAKALYLTFLGGHTEHHPELGLSSKPGKCLLRRGYRRNTTNLLTGDAHTGIPHTVPRSRLKLQRTLQ